ncbi:hypothetical protein SAMN05216575_10235 [Ectopseudomonas alcaliphila]|uniref:Uncharacterized protein n=1 Tax=Ectopseudomonas alcaliphila TaxID=101564 RepID=A0A1G7ATZ3_9GAMM|nr:hypothetical protein SAMN05216575_10235 [Pseudomonas alcaliphila]
MAAPTVRERVVKPRRNSLLQQPQAQARLRNITWQSTSPWRAWR